MSTLVAITYPDETTAIAAGEEVPRLVGGPRIPPEAIAVISRDLQGRFHLTTIHHAAAGTPSWGMSWTLLFGLLFFIPVLGMGIGNDLATLMSKVARIGIEKPFQDQVRHMLQPGTSALFLAVDTVSPDHVVDELGRYGGTALKATLRPDQERDLQEALYGPETMSTVDLSAID